MSTFINKSLEERKKEVLSLLKKYPNRIPIYLEKSSSCTAVELDHKKKFLVPDELQVGQFLYTIRQRIKLRPDQALFIFFNKQQVNTNELLKNVYEKHRAQDDMLYATYTTENTFG
jgi:GABA(A) receptor-associated protein